ncbi:hypothetical protein, variant [Aphanomyces invadans]|uniref:Peptidase M20 dimerisation domain-containing protein n=1 Tax=Aphanomyces invadans TaxID=157072 RepID=A0A024UJZ4_9STRA|nr:hypothetical protein, variant [Aphanomyces invadans]ETW05903.1 hypothetical protein, variant [Aphanomyces invadans]|eukprot:XP_008865680.1 hypothetical protein, variant [Aphanomyces invadans]
MPEKSQHASSTSAPAPEDNTTIEAAMKRRPSRRNTATRYMPTDAEERDHTHQVLMYDTPSTKDAKAAKGIPAVHSSQGHLDMNNSFMTFRHKASISALALLRNPQRLCAGTQDNLIVIWELDEFSPAFSLEGHSRSIIALEVVPDSQTLISSSADQSLRVWDGKHEFQCVQVINGFNGHILSLIATTDTLFMASQDTYVKMASIVSPTTPHPQHTGHSAASHVLAPLDQWTLVPNHHGYLYGIHLYDDKSHRKLLFSCSSDSTIACWELPSMAYLTSLHGHRGSVLDIVSVGHNLFSASQDKTICCWDIESMRCNGVLKGHTAAVLSICSLEDKNRICSGSADDTVRIWNTQSLACVHTLHGHHGGISGILSTEMFVFSASDDSTVRVWDIDFISNLTSTNSTVNGPHHDTASHKFKLDATLLATSNKQTSDASMIHLLRKFVAIQTVSVDPTMVDECWLGAKFLKNLLRQLGADCRVVHCGPGINPIVIGKLIHDPTKPTVLICGHYDVQPAAREDGWDTNPFLLTGQNGYLYGRGTTDDKGPIIATLFAIRELLSSSEGMAVSLPNFMFLYQGEGENQAQGFKEAVEDHLSYFSPVDLIFISNNYWLGDHTPCLTYGMRGCLEIEVQVDGPAVDVHAGVDGGAIRQPMLDLVALLNGILDSRTGRFTHPGFYDNVRPVTPDEVALLHHTLSDFDVDTYKQTLGVRDLLPPFLANATTNLSVNVLMNRWRFPSASVSAIKGSIDNSSIIPRAACTELTLRTVPDQSPEEMEALVLAHIRAQFDALGSSNTLSLHVKANVPWWLGDLDSGYFKAAERALEKHWKKKPMMVREGGSSQISMLLKTTLQAPVMHFPMGQASDRAHLQNERIRLRNLRTGKDALVDFFAAIATDASIAKTTPSRLAPAAGLSPSFES